MRNPPAPAWITVPGAAAGGVPTIQSPVAKQTRLWTGAILLMGLCVIATAWFPLLSITALPSKNYNEGWNAYRQWMAAVGQPLYGSPSALWTTNYPFLSFHIVGFLGCRMGGMVLAGRMVCFASLIATALLIGGIIRTVTASRAAAVYAVLCLFAWLAAFYGTGRAVDDPEMLSLAFTSLGLFAYLKNPQGGFLLAISAMAFAVSLFTKHDLIAIPFSVGIHLLLGRNWRGLAIFLGVGAGAAGLLLALSSHLDGDYFFNVLLQPRAYSVQNLIKETLHYLLHFFLPLGIGIAVLLSDPKTPYRRFLFILLISTHLAAVVFAGGDGVGSNIFYPPLIAGLLTFVIALSQLEHSTAERPRAGRHFRVTLSVATLFAGLMASFQFSSDIAAALRLPAATTAAQQAIARLKSTHGPAICEDLLLCYQAGKPLGFDPYYVNDQILIGRLQQNTILGSLAAHQYAVIQIDGELDAASLAKRHGGRFSETFLSQLLVQYRPVMVNPSYSVFVPAAGSGAKRSRITKARAAGG